MLVDSAMLLRRLRSKVLVAVEACCVVSACVRWMGGANEVVESQMACVLLVLGVEDDVCELF